MFWLFVLIHWGETTLSRIHEFVLTRNHQAGIWRKLKFIVPKNLWLPCHQGHRQVVPFPCVQVSDNELLKWIFEAYLWYAGTKISRPKQQQTAQTQNTSSHGQKLTRTRFSMYGTTTTTAAAAAKMHKQIN